MRVKVTFDAADDVRGTIELEADVKTVQHIFDKGLIRQVGSNCIWIPSHRIYSAVLIGVEADEVFSHLVV